MTGETKLCPFCREEIKIDAIRCRYCQAMLDGSMPVTGSGSTPGRQAGGTPVSGSGGSVGQGGILSAGVVVQNYEIQRVLGQGGMGVVYEAVHQYTQQRVALKAVWQNLMGEESTRRRFLEEGRTMAALEHPHIVPLLNFFEEGGTFYLAMKFLEGKTLDDTLKESSNQGGSLDVATAVTIAGQVLAALGYAHSQPAPIVHRDIKPQNIMLTREGKAILMDFGIAKVLGREQLTKTRGVVGTYEYMSPEQVKGEPVSPASDVYSMGIVLYQMLAGTAPFPQTSETGIECMNGHLSGEVADLRTLRPDCPAGLAAVVAKALEKDPARRHRDAREMGEALGARSRPMVRRPGSDDPVALGLAHLTPALRAVVVKGMDPVFTDRYSSVGEFQPALGAAVATGESTNNLLSECVEEKSEEHQEAEGENPNYGQAMSDLLRRIKWFWVLPVVVAAGFLLWAGIGGLAPILCSPNCEGKTCGDDGCGGSCGACTGQDECQSSKCVCVPRCEGKTCGDDGCGGSCGACTGQGGCQEGGCVCVPHCEGKTCGDDGCKGSCGACTGQDECHSSKCVCVPRCEGKTCGNDGCGGTCPASIGDVCWKGASLGLKFVPIPAGTFQMGCSPNDTRCRGNESPVHQVMLSGFSMLETEVTEAQYKAVMGENPSDHYHGASGPDMPAEHMTWSKAKDFCEAIAGRLPTEAEWEYAARGGKTTKYYCGDDASCLDGIAWYGDNSDTGSGNQKHAVKGKTPNAYGLYDMLGNVFEWNSDWHGDYGARVQTNPKGTVSGSIRVKRGGAFMSSGFFLRVSGRFEGVPLIGGFGLVGLRCCRSQPTDAVCVPNCEGKTCGNDGCGGSCGACNSGYICNELGACDLDWVFSRPAGLYLAKTEVTVGQYRACVEAGTCESKYHRTKSDSKDCNWGYSDRDNHPMNCVDWYGADAFCKWAGGRLPTSEEWAAEASNGGSRVYPWGDKEVTCSLAIWGDGSNTDGCGKDHTWPVCSKTAGNSVSGVCDMSGNVWEWMSDGQHDWRWVRGGSWDISNPEDLRAAGRFGGSPGRRNLSGFRCVRVSQ